MESDRRRWPRYPFVADVEVKELASSALIKACTRDLGVNGCYVPTLDPFTQRSVITVRINYEGQSLVAGGVVAHVQPNAGMGLTFITLESGCASLLDAWLREAAAACK